MEPFSAKELLARDKVRQDVKKQTYQALLTQFCRKIKTSHELGHKEAILTVPPFILGFPRYDLAVAVRYMARQVQKLGYMVEFVGPVSMRVQWKKLRTEIETQEEEHTIDILPGLANLQKTAQKLRLKH